MKISLIFVVLLILVFPLLAGASSTMFGLVFPQSGHSTQEEPVEAHQKPVPTKEMRQATGNPYDPIVSSSMNIPAIRLVQNTPVPAQPVPSSDTACSMIWKIPMSGITLPLWLTTPSNTSGLATQYDYADLGGELIRNGEVDASSCHDNGLLINGSASPCGQAAASEKVYAWQNQFDSLILDAAVANKVPAKLLKRIFAYESQFWPAVSDSGIEYGLGHVTLSGLDPLFQSYPEIYASICSIVFDETTCKISYADLPDDQKAMLRGYYLGNYVDPTCPDCLHGINMEKTRSSIDMFAKLLVANCKQVNGMIYNQTDRHAGSTTSYEDLWSITLANYNVGSGCVEAAIQKTYSLSYATLTWGNISYNLKDTCTQAYYYAESIKK
ncbi:MAG: hypothetical protein EHM41_21090 [Chloroflexi bacterium]|nr:MAG: hypothetical protein EHM41_21090 [Chloroflexota bacterium]